MDGCHRGWFAVKLGPDAVWSVSCYSSIEELWQDCRQVRLTLIDIPIGLKDAGREERLCDLEARKLLGKRASSVFRPPCRPALVAGSYSRALAVNRRYTGTGISLQAFNITARIAEVDRFLSGHPQARGVIRETHPEVCFCMLAGGIPMQYSKKKAQGRRERRDILASAWAQADEIVRFSLSAFLRRDVAEDDVLDALAAALAAWKAVERDYAVTLPAHPEIDIHGLPMEIVYP